MQLPCTPKHYRPLFATVTKFFKNKGPNWVADDTYIIISGETTSKVIRIAKDLSMRHVSYVELLGMVANKTKPDVISKFTIDAN